MVRIRSHSTLKKKGVSSDPKAVKAPRLRVAEAVEAGVEGLLLFLVRYIRTGIRVIFTPRATGRLLLIDRHTAKPVYVLPLTYLSIGLFLLSLLGQVAGTYFWDWIWFTDELASKVTDSLSKEVSLIKVAVQALPGVFVVALFAGMLRLATSRHAPQSRRLVPFVLSYAFGAQAFLLFLVAFVFVVLDTIVGKGSPPGGELGSDVFIAFTYLALLGGLAAAFVGPVIFTFTALRLGRIWRRKRWLAVAIGTFLMAGLIFGHLAVLYATDLPSLVVERAKGETTPEVNVGEVEYWVRPARLNVRLDLTLHNRGAKSNSWKARNIKIQLFDVAAPSTGKMKCIGGAFNLEGLSVSNSTGSHVQFASLDTDQTQWFEVTGSAPLDDRTKSWIAKGGNWGVNIDASFLKDEAKLDCAILEPRSISKRVDLPPPLTN